MALVDGSAEFHSNTVAIIRRAARLGLFTAAEAGRLIHRLRPSVPIGQFDDRIERHSSATRTRSRRCGGMTL